MKKIYLFATIFAILTGLAVYNFAGALQRKSAAVNASTISVVAAARDIPENTLLTPEMVTTLQLPAGSEGRAATNASLVVGKITRYPLLTGEYILPDKLGDAAGGGESALSYSIEKGRRAISVSVDEVLGVSYYLTKGDHVDILCAMNIGEKPASVTLVENVKVLALGTATATDKTKGYTTVTLSVTPAEALKINYAMTNGRILLTMRPVLDSGTGGASVYMP